MKQYIVKFKANSSKFRKYNDLLEYLTNKNIWVVSSVVTEYLEQSGAKLDSLVHLEIYKATVIIECAPFEFAELGI